MLTNDTNGKTLQSLLIFLPKVTIICLGGATGVHMVSWSHAYSCQIFAIKVATQAGGLSLWVDIKCHRSTQP